MGHIHLIYVVVYLSNLVQVNMVMDTNMLSNQLRRWLSLEIIDTKLTPVSIRFDDVLISEYGLSCHLKWG